MATSLMTSLGVTVTPDMTVTSPDMQRSPTDMQRSPTDMQRSPTDMHRSPIAMQRSPTNMQRSPTNMQRSPTNMQRSPTDMQRSPRSPADLRSPTYDKANSKSPTLLSQDLSRRKQRKPKSLTSPGHSSSVSNSDQETVKDEPCDATDPTQHLEVHVNTMDDTDLDTGQQDPELSPGLPGIDDVTRKWNMFPFGEVIVPSHPPGVPVVPLALQMVYLYPLGREEGDGEGVRYRMLVPTGNVSSQLLGGRGDHELAVSPPPSGSRQHWSHHRDIIQGKRSPDVAGESCLPERSRSRSAHTLDPLDLTNKSPEPSDLSTREIKGEISPNHVPQPPPLQKQPQPQLPTLMLNNSNRCNECNINFSKFSNYQAHKKYYCNGAKASEREERGVSPQPSAKFNVQVPKSKSPQNAGGSSQLSDAPGASGEPRGAAPGDVRELVMKQQEALLASLKCLPPRPLLMPNPRLPGPSLQSQAMSFACTGCGICFKSISNLQAHQSRYCAGMNKKNEEMKFLEALIKSVSQPQAAGGGSVPPPLSSPGGTSSILNSASAPGTSSAPSPQPPTAAAIAALLAAGLPTAGAPSLSAAGMPGLSDILAVLSSRSASSSAGGSDKSDSEKDRGEGLVKQEESCGSGDQVFCKFCGLKESKEKLIDHIYSHIVDHVKKRKSEEEESGSDLSPEKRLKLNELVKQEDIVAKPDESIVAASNNKDEVAGGGNSAPSNPGFHCEFCGIRFSQPAAHSAHVQYYCQKKVKTE